MAAEKETDFDPSLDSVALNAARVMNHVLQASLCGGGEEVSPRSLPSHLAPPLTLPATAHTW